MKLNKTPRSEKNIEKLFNEDFIWELTEIASDVCHLNFTYPEKIGQQELQLDYEFLTENNKKMQEYMGYYDVYVEYTDIEDCIDTILHRAYDENENLAYYPKQNFLTAIKSTVANMEWISAEGNYLTVDEMIELLPIVSRKPSCFTPITLPKYTIYEELRDITRDVDNLTIDYILLDLGLQDLILNSDMTLSDFWRSNIFNNWLEENGFKKWDFWLE